VNLKVISKNRLVFPLAQGWARGLFFGFEDRDDSAKLISRSEIQTRGLQQVHGREIISLRDVRLASHRIPGDGIFCDAKDLFETRDVLTIETADCVPLVVIDQNSQKLALLHAGWRGLQKGIHRVPFEQLGFDPRTSWVWIGPSLDGDTFAVREDMWSLFDRRFVNDARVFRPSAGDPSQKFFSPWNFLAEELKQLQVPLVYNVEENTFLNANFASYRRAKQMQEGPSRNLSWLAGFDPLEF
jgi:copper oxidase (laccase) domain-containing protein